MTEAPARLRVRIRPPVADPTVHTLHGPECVLGSGPDCALGLPPTVDAVHCVLAHTRWGWFVEDVASEHGTFLNGRRIQQAFLGPGDTLRLADVRIDVL